jgi:nitrous oxidase accessory protein NosD
VKLNRFLPTVICAAAAAAACGTAAPAYASPVTVVPPGASIQEAVDAAPAGSVIQLRAGRYAGGVAVHTDRITIRGTGPGTILTPGDSDNCGPDAAGSGICVTGAPDHPVRGVRIESLMVRGFEAFGVVGMGTDRLQVSRVVASGNGEYGITEFGSTRGSFTHNWVLDNAAEAGLYVGDIADAGGTVVADNHAYGNALGVLVRHAHHVRITGNVLVGNCTGVALVDDGQPGGQGHAWVGDNIIANNNKFCPAHEEVPPLGGSGVVLVGGEHNAVTRNIVINNRGDQPFSGGVVLEPGVSHVPASGNLVWSNLIRGNGPADIIDHSGGHNWLRGNRCTTSIPDGLCGRH